MEFFHSHAHRASADLATERGIFPTYRGSRLQALGQRHRNATVITIAPTDSISYIANCSPGIEPPDGGVLTSLHPAFIRRAQALGLELELAALQADRSAHPSIQPMTVFPNSCGVSSHGA